MFVRFVILSDGLWVFDLRVLFIDYCVVLCCVLFVLRVGVCLVLLVGLIAGFTGAVLLRYGVTVGVTLWCLCLLICFVCLDSLFW